MGLHMSDVDGGWSRGKSPPQSISHQGPLYYVINLMKEIFI